MSAETQVMLQLLKYSHGQSTNKIKTLLEILSDKHLNFLNHAINSGNRIEYDKVKNDPKYLRFISISKRILDVYNMLLEIKIIPDEVELSIRQNDELHYNYHLKNYYIRVSSIIDGCSELLNYSYELSLIKKECIISNIRKCLKEKGIYSKSFDILSGFNKINFNSHIETKNDIIHRCDLKNDYITMTNSIMINLDISEYLNNGGKKIEFNEIVKEVAPEINTHLSNSTKIIEDFLYEFLNNLMIEIKFK